MDTHFFSLLAQSAKRWDVLVDKKLGKKICIESANQMHLAKNPEACQGNEVFRAQRPTIFSGDQAQEYHGRIVFYRCRHQNATKLVVFGPCMRCFQSFLGSPMTQKPIAPIGLSKVQAAKFMGVSAVTFQKALQTGRVPPGFQLTERGHCRWHPETLTALLKQAA